MEVYDRVRIKFGIDRGRYGTIIHKGGDNGDYYGVELDCAPNPVGYSDYELEVIPKNESNTPGR